MKRTEWMTGALALGMMIAGCSASANEEQQPVKGQDQVPEESGKEQADGERPDQPEKTMDGDRKNTEKEPQEPAQPETAAGTDQIRPEFKAAMDEYVAFYEDYAAFMQRYRENPSDLNLLLEMTDWISRGDHHR